MELLNLDGSETLYQRCVLVKGRCDGGASSKCVFVKTTDAYHTKVFPDQTWPVADGEFRALVFLVPGENRLVFTSDTDEKVAVSVSYTPLTNIQPLHLAILVAKDSPLTMDCSPVRSAGISNAHSSLDAAVAKLRMAAYMWMAYTAEDLRMKGLGRRAFRLEEEWTIDTVSCNYTNAKFENTLHNGAMQTTAKVHIVRTDKTTKDLRKIQAGPPLAPFPFDKALAKHGAPFDKAARPVISGLVLDSHYSYGKKMIRGDACGLLGGGRSLAVTGSSFVYSFPSYVEEVVSCLTDTRNAGDTVAPVLDAEPKLWEAFSYGSKALLSQLSSAFGTPSVIEPLGDAEYALDWPEAFLPSSLVPSRRASGKRSKSKSQTPTPLPQAAPPPVRVQMRRGPPLPPPPDPPALPKPLHPLWQKCSDVDDQHGLALANALQFQFRPHFRMPYDQPLSSGSVDIYPTVRLDTGEGDDALSIVVECSVGIARIAFRGVPDESPTLTSPVKKLVFTQDELLDRFTHKKALDLAVLAYNGRTTEIEDVWKLMHSIDYIKIPGRSVRLTRKSAATAELTRARDDHFRTQGNPNSQQEEAVPPPPPLPDFWPQGLPPPPNVPGRDYNSWFRWNILLTKRLENGTIIRANSITTHIGACFDGLVVHYANNTSTNGAPMYTRAGGEFHVGGNTTTLQLAPGEEIVRLEIPRGEDALGGVHLVTSNGQRIGQNNNVHGQTRETIEPPTGHKVVGLYGAWRNPYHTDELGIITAPRDFELPAEAYELDELNNRCRNDPDRRREARDRDRGGRNNDGGNEDASDTESSAEAMESGLEESGSEMEEDEHEDSDAESFVSTSTESV